MAESVVLRGGLTAETVVPAVGEPHKLEFVTESGLGVYLRTAHTDGWGRRVYAYNPVLSGLTKGTRRG